MSATKKPAKSPAVKAPGRSPVIVILGPTASGKSELAIKLAKRFPGQIVSADSRQIYQGLNIGTGKVAAAQQRQVKHYLLDIVKPSQQLYLPQYQRLANQALSKISQAGYLPFLVGGTGLYLSAVIENYQIPKVAPQSKRRRQLEKMTAKALFSLLKKLDFQTAKKIDRYNKRRLIRAIEFSQSTGQSFLPSQKIGQPKFNFLLIGLQTDRARLYGRINKRVAKMLQAGLAREVKRLVKRYGWQAPALTSIGYQEWRPYFEGQQTRAQVLEKIQQNSRNYAKRQLTWFQRMAKRSKINWLTNSAQANALIKKFISN